MTKTFRPRCSAIHPPSFKNMKGGQCRKRAKGSVETHIDLLVHHPVCDDPTCALLVRNGYSSAWKF